MMSESTARVRLTVTVALLQVVLLVVVASASAKEPVGQVVWVDLLTEDADVAPAFYTALFNWSIQDTATGTLLVTHQNRAIGGISEIADRLPEVDESMWLVGVAVKNVKEAVAAARQRGAVVRRDTTRLDGFARFAVIEDPQGATVLLLDPQRELGGSEGPGSWVWAELWTRDVEAASAFYADVIGYELDEMQRHRGVYNLFSSGGEPRAGLVELEDLGIEPSWVPYIGVADLEATVGRARELGGRVLLASDVELAEGRVALLADPTGAGFFVYELQEDSP